MIRKTFIVSLFALTALAAGFSSTFGSETGSVSLDVFTSDGSGEIAAFKQGEKLFTDRNYALVKPPAALEGRTFLRGPIDGMDLHCTSPGEMLVLTPVEAPRATSIAPALRRYGFTRDAAIEDFQLFGTNDYERVALYRKTLKPGDTLRFRKWCIVLGARVTFKQKPPAKPWAENDGEKLYNGIVLPEQWPPENIDVKSDAPMPVPYLNSPPKVINIDVGRQLFVDDFLIESTDLLHTYHMPEKYEGSPVLVADTALERPGDLIGSVGRPCIWWNPEKQVFYLWYQAGAYYNGTIALATSKDGIHWARPELDVNPGTNQALVPGFTPDSYGLVPDWDASDPQQRFKLFSTNPGATQPGFSFTSPDGIHWANKTPTGPTGDRSSMFYNPFRKKWVYSIRSGFRGRSRNYHEHSDFLAGAAWDTGEPWLAADVLDAPEPGYKHKTQLYNFDAVAYESVMLGFFEMHRGPENNRCHAMGLPKLNEISFGYSRDGFHFARPDRRAHIPAGRKDVWDRGFIESGGNICVIVGDKLHFYYSGCRGNLDAKVGPDGRGPMAPVYDPNSIGFYTLRRDGFASLFAGISPARVTTRPVVFSGSQLFVNVDCPQGEIKAEILDGDKVVAELKGFTGDSTIACLGDVSAHAGKPVRIRFTLRRGSLYAFWVSRDETGRSNGYVAGGGPGYTGHVDKYRTRRQVEESGNRSQESRGSLFLLSPGSYFETRGMERIQKSRDGLVSVKIFFVNFNQPPVRSINPLLAFLRRQRQMDARRLQYMVRREDGRPDRGVGFLQGQEFPVEKTRENIHPHRQSRSTADHADPVRETVGKRSRLHGFRQVFLHTFPHAVQ